MSFDDPILAPYNAIALFLCLHEHPTYGATSFSWTKIHPNTIFPPTPFANTFISGKSILEDRICENLILPFFEQTLFVDKSQLPIYILII